MFDWQVGGPDAASTLSLVSQARCQVLEQECALVELAAHWADLHHPDGQPPPAKPVPGREQARQLGGQGTPEVLEFAAAELGARMETTVGSARVLMADALDLRHRLPELWQLILAGQVPTWRDDGSGVGTMLETAEQMEALDITPENKVRFIFFSGEEQGLLGSDYYVSQLTKKQIQDISVMLDFDMLASPNYGRFIYDGNGDEHGFAGPNGSGTIERVFKDFWTSQGLAYETIPFDGRSDYDAFTTAGIPAGGIFAGAEVKKTPDQVQLYGGEAGVPFDVCYHQLCDRLTNINDRGLSEHSDAAVHAILTFAQTESSVNGTDQGASKKSKDWKGHYRVR